MEKNNMNSRLTIELMEKLHLFDSEMLEILKRNNIRSIQDLIDADLSKWKNLEVQRRKELEEARCWYDFSRLEEDEENIDSYTNRLLKREKGLLSCVRSYWYLHTFGVSTIGDLLNNKRRVFGQFLADKRIRKDISIAVKLLECKYLGIDPEIEITEEDSMETISDKLGFGTATKTALVDSTHGNHSAVILTPESFINIIKNSSEMEAREKLLSVKKLGKTRVDEIYYKSSIVLNYDKDSVKDLTPEEDLVAKYFKLLNESKRVKELDAQIDSELDSLLDKLASEGLLTEENISKHIR